MMRKSLLISILLLMLVGKTFAAKVSSGVDEQARLPYWELTSEHISLRLVQRLPDQSRGFFLARGFSSEQAETIAQSCVFQTVFKNISHQSNSATTIDYQLGDWVILSSSGKSALKTREDWQKEWLVKGVNQAARIAFEWALLPTQQHYKPGDYNWGMSMFNLKPGTRFDLVVHWRESDRRRSAKISNIECASDIHTDPATFGG